MYVKKTWLPLTPYSIHGIVYPSSHSLNAITHNMRHSKQPKSRTIKRSFSFYPSESNTARLCHERIFYTYTKKQMEEKKKTTVNPTFPFSLRNFFSHFRYEGMKFPYDWFTRVKWFALYCIVQRTIQKLFHRQQPSHVELVCMSFYLTQANAFRFVDFAFAFAFVLLFFCALWVICVTMWIPSTIHCFISSQL